MIHYLIKILIIFLVNINILFAADRTDEIILFKINDNAYTSIDLEIRKNYLKLLNEDISYDGEFLLKDYISVLIFSKFYNIANHNLKELNINSKYKEIYSAKKLYYIKSEKQKECKLI